MSAAGNGTNQGAPQPGPQPRIQAIGQYIKDLSFENPGAPAGLSQRPAIELNVDVHARRMDTEHFEVELRLRVTAKAEDKPLFLLELSYGGLFQIQNMPDEVLQQVLLIEAPHLLFPFARRIVADVVRDGGMPPLMIEPIDFMALYRAKAAQMQPARAGIDTGVA